MNQESLDSYRDEYLKADSLVREKKYEEAIKIFEHLLTKKFHEFHRSMIWINISVIRDLMGESQMALDAYEEAIVLERPYEGYFALENKAAYLAKLNRYQESLDLYQQLLRRTNLKPDDRVRMETNINTLGKLKKEGN